MKPFGLFLFFGFVVVTSTLKAQYPEFIIKETHPKLQWVSSEEMGDQPGFCFRQKGYKGGGFDPQFTHVMLWIQPIRSYPWSEKAHAKFLQDLKLDSLTPYVRNFAMDTRNKQRQALDPIKHQQVELGMPEIIEIMGYRGLQFSYKFTRTDNELLNTVKKNRFTARRIILFLDHYIAELNWEYVPDENNWQKVVIEQLNTVLVK
jgi:hypothetical protein